MIDMDVLTGLGIDTEEGLAYCADDPEFYEEMIGEFLNESSVRLSGLKKSYEEENWPQYRIIAHSVKSTSKMIGADAVSDHAREMETACKEEDPAAVRFGHERFVQVYEALTAGLRTAFRP